MRLPPKVAQPRPSSVTCSLVRPTCRRANSAIVTSLTRRLRQYRQRSPTAIRTKRSVEPFTVRLRVSPAAGQGVLGGHRVAAEPEEDAGRQPDEAKPPVQ